MPINITASKENILKKIRSALSETTPIPFPQSEGNTGVFQPSKQELEVEFAEKFSRLQGKFAYCMDIQELVAQLSQLLAQREWKQVFCKDQQWIRHLTENGFSDSWHMELGTCDVAITGCELLVARTGSIVITAAGESGRTTSVYAPVHICIARTSQLVYDIKDALLQVKEKYSGKIPSLITFASGPSRTADIEKTLVTGVHGPKEVYCFLLEG